MLAPFGPTEAVMTLLCCAYILGLLVSALPWGGLLIVGIGTTAALLRSSKMLHLSRRWGLPIPQIWWRGPTLRWWTITSGVSLLATFYIQVSLPHPAFNDVSRLIRANQAGIPVEVSGTVESRPALTRRGSMQLWLTSQQATFEGKQQTVSGNLFVTLPRKSAKNLHPGQTVTITGTLYRPARVTRPHGFDFATYLAREGAFAGLKGTAIRVDSEGNPWGGWAIRARIVRSLQQGTDVRTGALLSALVLGKDAADVPYDLRDSFIQSGLAHALAASGFQVSLILTAVLTLGRSLSTSGQVGLGGVALLLYGLLSGAEASIVRAILMGCASLIALGLKRQVRPASALLVIAVLMLVFKPLWIWDLGFQLSVLATLGLVATASPLAAILDWLPPTVASMVAVPLAATLWTLPLQLYIFGVLPLYSLVANVITTLLLSALTIGGFVGSLVALVWPLLGSGVAWVLQWPTQLLTAIVSGVAQLPGHSLALGSISMVQLLALYGCIVVVWLVPTLQKHWRLATAVGLLLIVVPLWQVQTQRFLVTVFDQTRLPMMVIEHPKGTVVLNSGDRLSVSQSLVPFLQQEGINRIDWAIDTNAATNAADSTSAGWTELLRQMPIQLLSRCIPRAMAAQPLSPQPKQQVEVNPQERLTLGPFQMVLWRAQPATVELQIGSQRWLLVDSSTEADFAAWLTTVQLPPIQVLWWTGQPISAGLVAQLHPQALLLSGKHLSSEVVAALEAVVPRVLWTERDGTLQWTPSQDFTTTVNPGDNNLSPLG